MLTETINLKRSALRLVNYAQTFARQWQPEVRRRRATQVIVEARLDSLAKAHARHPPASGGKTLIDGMWYNPNFWYRLTLLRAALGTAAGEEVGLLGEYSRGRSRGTFRSLGINSLRSFPDLVKAARSEAATLADRILADTRTADDILRWKLPMGFPAEMVYDGLLKFQRAAMVNIHDRNFRADTIEAIANCLAAERLIAEEKPSRVVLTHAVHLTYAAIGWAAMRQNIATVVLYGNYGVPRFFRLSSPADFFDWNNGPTASEIDAMDPKVGVELRAAGIDYLTRRFAGLTNDLGGQLAFGGKDEAIRRETMAARHGMKKDAPTIAVYASNWFDFPHSCGMTNFRDFRDWLEVTIAAAIETPSVNWIFKPHPADLWYGGTTLADLMPKQMPPHVVAVPVEASGSDLKEFVDGMITVHSTGGLEYAASGKPVLLADRGWYDKSGIGVVATSRADYLKKLREPWWEQADPRARERSQILAATYFCTPLWQSPILLRDDSNLDALWADLDRVLDQTPELEKEIALIADWMARDLPRYHNYKMAHGGPYGLGNAN